MQIDSNDTDKMAIMGKSAGALVDVGKKKETGCICVRSYGFAR